MSRISRFVVLVAAAASLVGVMSSTAGAVTWTNDGATAFTATGGQGTLTSTGVTIAFASWDLTGTAPASSTGSTYLITGTRRATGCVAAGSPCAIHCGFTMTATAIHSSFVTGSWDLTCEVYVSGTKLCHIEGASPAIYANETATLSAFTSFSYRLTGAFCPAGSDDLTHLSQLTSFKVTSPSPPTITRA